MNKNMYVTAKEMTFWLNMLILKKKLILDKNGKNGGFGGFRGIFEKVVFSSKSRVPDF
jgi:hypothetical protein